MSVTRVPFLSYYFPGHLVIVPTSNSSGAPGTSPSSHITFRVHRSEAAGSRAGGSLLHDPWEFRRNVVTEKENFRFLPSEKKKKAMTLSDSRVWYLVNVSMSPWPSESFQGSFLPPCLLPPHFGKFLWEGAGSHPKNLGQAGLCRISLYHAAATSQIERQTLSRR